MVPRDLRKVEGRSWKGYCDAFPAEVHRKQEARRQERKGKPLCEVLSPDVAREAEVEFTRQIESDRDVQVKVSAAFKDAVAREFRRIAYTGTMGWRQKLNRPAHEVALGIWLADT